MSPGHRGFVENNKPTSGLLLKLLVHQELRQRVGSIPEAFVSQNATGSLSGWREDDPGDIDAGQHGFRHGGLARAGTATDEHEWIAGMPDVANRSLLRRRQIL